MSSDAATEPGIARSSAPDGRRSDVPVVPDPWVERPRLLARLDVASERALTLVIAPAGAGKTVTLARWAREHDDHADSADHAVRWFSARQRVDVRSFGQELLSAAGGRSDLEGASGTVAEQIADICEALAPLQAREIVVIDDAHRLSHSCFVLLAELLNRCPDAVHVVLLSRWDPPVPLLLLEIQGNVSVIRGHQLRMTPPEARQLVTLHSGPQRRNVVDAVVRYAQGWAAVLVLAGQTLRKDPHSVPSALTTMDGNGPGLVDLLASQVFSSLTEQQRHVLLCISAEDTVTPVIAARLSGNPQSGELLEDLERVGLLVGREPPPSGDDSGQVHFRLHPLLLEVLRRRLASNGVEVMRARAVVLKAAALDQAHGEVETALRRMLWVRAFEPAADLVAEHGLDLLVRGDGDLVHRLAISAPDVIAGCPQAWLTMALERRRQGDHTGVAHWTQRVLSRVAVNGADPGPDEFDLALVHLLRSVSGEYDMSVAADDADRLVESRPFPLSYPRRALLLVELSAAETWLGRLASAAGHLASAAAMCTAAGFDDLLPDALSRLATVELLRGRNATAIEVATQVLAVPSRGASEEHQNRAALILELARLQTLPWALQAPEGAGLSVRQQDSDLTMVFLRQVLTARVAAGRGADGRTVLQAGPQLPVDLPAHVSVRLDLERTAYAIEAGDVIDLRSLAAHMASLGAKAEAACLEAVLAEIGADLTGAEEMLAGVVSGDLEATVPYLLPHVLVCTAQIADARGDRARADALMLEAVRATAPQRYAVPFLGWSFRGTPVPVLLARLCKTQESAWGRELYESLGRAGVEDKAHVGAPVVPAHHVVGLAWVSDSPATIPPLTRREGDVLFELAHGSSYADIATSLVITENTVKTHVSSLYAKLGVTRRSHALRAARAVGLI